MDVVQRTQSFYDWEIRGRGWSHYDYPVALEPPFRRMRRWSGSSTTVDDGQRPTLLSRFFEGFKPKNVVEVEEQEEQPPPSVGPLDFDERLILVPQDLALPTATIVSWLHGVATVRNRCVLEIVADSGVVELRLAATRGDLTHLSSQLSALVPDVSLREPKQPLADLLAPWLMSGFASIDLGLAAEFMVPIAEAVTEDPLLPVLTVLSDLRPDCTAVVQVLFEPVDAPWREEIVTAVQTPPGRPFFADAPEITKRAYDKVSSPMFAAAVRCSAFCDEALEAEAVVGRVSGALSFASGIQSNELIPLGLTDPREAVHDLLGRTNHRSGMLLSAEELAQLIKLPGETVRLPQVLRPTDRTKRAPTTVRIEGCELGTNEHAGERASVSLSETARMKHVHLLGASGVGKSTLMVRMILNDIQAGYGVGVLDPHGDLVREVAARLPQTRESDVVMFDPGDREHLVGWNVLQAGSDTERDLLTSDLVGVFRRLSTSWGDQMNAVFANAIMVFLEPEIGGTLVDLRKFLADNSFRRSVVERIEDPLVRGFWETEFPLIERRRPQAPILTRLDAFLRSKPVRRVLTVENPKLDFKEVTDRGLIFLGNLSMGSVGEDNAALLGSLLVSRFHQVSLMRSAVREEDRRPFYLYIDEFHHVATPSMASLFSGARKFRLGLTVAHQDLYQLRANAPDLERALLANAYSRICFRLGDDDARQLDKGFSYFTADDLMSLNVGQAVGRVGTRSDDFNLETERLPNLESAAADRNLERVRKSSGERWSVPEPVQPAAGDRDRVAEPKPRQEQSQKKERAPAQGREVDKSLGEGSEVTEQKQVLSKATLDYLETVAAEPFLGVRERNESLGLGAWKGDREKKLLLAESLVREVTINPGSRGGQFKLLELTIAGRAALSEYGIALPKGHGRGGLAHQWWARTIAEWLLDHDSPSAIEDESHGVRVDLVSTWFDQKIAIEIDFRIEQAIKNIEKDLEANFDCIVSCVDGTSAADQLRSKVSGLLTHHTPVVITDLREFESVFESLRRQNQNGKPGGKRRRRTRQAAQQQPRTITLDGGALDTPSAALYLGLSPATLETMRTRGGGPRFSKLGRRVVYEQEELESWLNSRSKRSTSDAS